MTSRRQRKMPRKSCCGQFYTFAIFSLIFTFIFFILYGMYDIYQYDDQHKFKQTQKSGDSSLSLFNDTSIREKNCPCSSTNSLTYIKNEGGKSLLRVRKIVESYYASEGTRCCYSNVSLRDGAKFGNPIGISECEVFQEEVELETPVVIVKCMDNVTKKEVYSNAHVVTRWRNKTPITAQHFSKNPLNVLIISINDISTSTIQPMYPQTYNFIKTNDWINFKAYHHVTSNARVNIMAMLTGYESKSPRKFLDEDSIWNDFKNNNYTLGYFDKTDANFLDDRYLRSYIIACEILRLSSDGSCRNSSAEIIFNLIEIFVRKRPFFGLFWMDDQSSKDFDVIRFLEYILIERITDHTFVVLFGGKSENGDESLLYFGLPKWFGHEFSEEYDFLKANSLRRATTYDVFMTLQDILVLTGFNLTLKDSKACPKCRSLFKSPF